MGMDVHGKNPTTKEGEYFRANCWSWRPIHLLINIANAEHGNTIISEETMQKMGYNDGAGLNNQKECDYLASAMEEILNDPKLIEKHGLIYVSPREGEAFFTFPLEPSMAVNKEGRFAEPSDDHENLFSPWRTCVSHVHEFVKFLRDCGGFEVW